MNQMVINIIKKYARSITPDKDLVNKYLGIIGRALNEVPNTFKSMGYDLEGLIRDQDDDATDELIKTIIGTARKSVLNDPELKGLPLKFDFLYDPNEAVRNASYFPFENRLAIILGRSEAARLVYEWYLKKNHTFLKDLSTDIGHELIHAQQGGYSKGIKNVGRLTYLANPREIMAYAYSVVNEAIKNGYSKEQLLGALKDPLSHKGSLSFLDYYKVFKDLENNKEMAAKDKKDVWQKFLKHIYVYIDQLYGSHE